MPNGKQLVLVDSDVYWHICPNEKKNGSCIKKGKNPDIILSD